MSSGLKQDIKNIFSKTHMVNRIILIVILLSLIYIIANVIARGLIYNLNINDFLFLSSDLMVNLIHPWVLLTHLFIAKSLYELIWLMILFYWFGSVIGDLLGDDKILPLYLISGLLGSAIFMIFTNLLNLDYFYISGVESGVIGTMVAAAVLVPDYRFDLVLIGKVRIKFIVIAVIAIDLLFLYASSRYQYLSFPGAILAGWYFILSIKAGKGIHVPVNNFISNLNVFFKNIFKTKKGRLKLEHKAKSGQNQKSNDTDTEKLNHILDKIKIGGYDSLTEEEKHFLFRASNKP
ncbi:MAG: rhomboid family intramembrane serine protease [Deltaproteobacteria bacterium]